GQCARLERGWPFSLLRHRRRRSRRARSNVIGRGIMFLKLTADGELQFEDRQNFRAFKLVVEGDRRRLEGVGRAVAGKAEPPDAETAWIYQAALRQRTSLAAVLESPLANSVTSWPWRTNSSVRYETTRSMPPYSCGGTLSYRGATCAILIECSPPAGSLVLVVDARLRQALARLLGETNLHQRGAQLAPR